MFVWDSRPLEKRRRISSSREQLSGRLSFEVFFPKGLDTEGEDSMC